MAKRIQKRSQLQKQYDRCGRNIIMIWTLALCLPLAAAAALWKGEQPEAAVVVLSLGCCIGLLLGLTGSVVYGRKRRILAFGLAGEAAAAAELCRLPERYTCYQNLTICHRGHYSELDLVVTGPSGVCIIEVKNQNGTICGDAQQTDWVQEKVGRRGGQYSKQLYSPIKQVATHSRNLSGWLQEKGCPAYVHSAVHFSNPKAVVNMQQNHEKIPVFTCGQEARLRHFITGQSTRLSRQQLQRLNQILEEQ